MNADPRWATVDYYKILDIRQSADATAIKKAYRKLALNHHPDLAGDDETSAAKFKAAAEAYETLSDPTKRKAYDTYRSLLQVAPASSTGFMGFGSRTRATDAQLRDLFHDAGVPTPEPSRPTVGFEAPIRGKDYHFFHTLTFEEALTGSVVNFMLPTGVQLPVELPIINTFGEDNKTVLVAKGKGGKGSPAGDFRLTITVLPPKNYTLEDDGLHITIPLTYPELLRGLEVHIPLLDDTQVKFNVPPRTQPTRIFRLSHHGPLKADGSRHDLYVHLRLAFPSDDDLTMKHAADVYSAALKDFRPRG